MARLHEEYNKRIKKELMDERKYQSIMQVPTLEKIVINVGVGEALTNKGAIDEVGEILMKISGQKPVVNKAKKAVSAFKVREGMDL